MVEDKQFYTDVKASDECQCERPKTPPHPFCFDCYRKLPSFFQKGLYKPIGNGFERGYEDSVEYLSED